MKKPHIFRVPPKDFIASLEIAVCYTSCKGKYLFLYRSKKCSQPHTWCTPGGKLEPKESPIDAVIRELKEETSVELDPKKTTSLGALYIRGIDIDYTCHLFTYDFLEEPTISLSSEHECYKWLFFKEALQLPLIKGEPEVIFHFSALTKLPVIPRKSFYFVRHGQTDLYEGESIQFTDPDLPLNNIGKKQAFFIQNTISQLPIKTVSFSPLQRAKETKEIITNSLNVEHFENPKLKECNADTWIKMVLFEEGQGYKSHPEVESFLSNALEGISQSLAYDGSTLIIAHGGVHWALCYHLSLVDHPWKIDHCKVVHFEPVGVSSWKATII
jgi:uncharacterized phosphatase